MTRIGPFGYDDEDDEWSEIVDAVVPRVDLVGKSANGVGHFLLMKGQRDGLLSPDQIRALITPTQNGSSTMNLIPGTNIPTTARSVAMRKSVLRKAAGKSKLVAVYAADGKLVGTCDPSKITAISSVTDPNAPKPPKAKAQPKVPAPTGPEADPAPATPEDATDGPAAGRAAPTPASVPDEAVSTVKKALAGAGFRDGSHAFAKSAGRSVDDRYASLVKSVDRGAQGRLGDSVAHAAMTMQFGAGMSGRSAVHLAKSIALDLAAVEARKPKPSIEAATAALRAARPLR